MCVASAMGATNFLLFCPRQRLMNSCIRAQVVAGSLAFTAASAAFNFTTSALLMALLTPGRALTLTIKARISASAVLTVTVTVKWQLPVLLEPSVAVQVTVVGPIGKVLPEAGKQVTLAAPQLSVAV